MLKKTIEKLLYGFQPEKVSDAEILFTIFLFLISYYYFKKLTNLKTFYYVVLVFYLILFSFFLLTNSNYEGIDRQGICGWIELSEQLQNGQSAYELQANRFIQGEEYVTNLKVSFYYPPTYKFFYDYLCKVDGNVFNYINIICFILIALLVASYTDEERIKIFIILFTGLSSSIWMLRQGQVVFIEILFLILSLNSYKNHKYYFGHLFLILFGLCRVYFLVLLLPILIMRKVKKEFYFIVVVGIFIFSIQWNLWIDYFYLWFSSDGYLFGDVTTYSNRISLFDEQLGRYAFSILLFIRFLFNTFLNIEWSSTLFPSLILYICVLVTSNIFIYYKFNKKPIFFRILIFIMLNFILYPVLKPYIFMFYFLAVIYLFQFKNAQYPKYSVFLFCIVGAYAHVVTNLISSTFTMELYQFIILNIHFMITFSKKFKKEV